MDETTATPCANCGNNPCTCANTEAPATEAPATEAPATDTPAESTEEAAA